MQASIKSGGRNPTNDAVLVASAPRSFGVSLANFLGSDYLTPPAGLQLTGVVLNVTNILPCSSDSCSFYTILKSDLNGSDGNPYNLPMRNVNVDVDWPPPATANCPYLDSRVRVEFHKAGIGVYTKNTWLVTPELQASLIPGYQPGPSFGAPGANCPNLVWPGNSAAPAAVAALRPSGTNNTFNYGQYSVPLYFKLEQQ